MQQHLSVSMERTQFEHQGDTLLRSSWSERKSMGEWIVRSTPPWWEGQFIASSPTPLTSRYASDLRFRAFVSLRLWKRFREHRFFDRCVGSIFLDSMKIYSSVAGIRWDHEKVLYSRVLKTATMMYQMGECFLFQRMMLASTGNGNRSHVKSSLPTKTRG